MQLHVSSNIVSGAYAVFEILTTIVLAHLLTSIAGTMNVKAVYEDRRKILLKASKVPAISDPGLTTPRVHSVTTFITVTVVLLTTAGQFAIVGVTEKEYEKVTVKYLVKKAPPGYVLNLKNHISQERNKVSTELLLLRQFLKCTRRRTSVREYYQYIFAEEGGIERPINDLSTDIDISCVTNDFGFENEIAIKWVPWSVPEAYEGRCRWTIGEAILPQKRMKRVSLEVEHGCAEEVKEGWCYLDGELVCAALLKYSEGLGLGVFIRDRLAERSVFISLLQPGEDLGTEKLKAALLLAAMRFTRSPASLVIVLSLQVERNGTVRRIISNARQVTRVNVPLLAAAVLSALAVLLLTATIALYTWGNVILIPGRQGYNRFNSPADLLSCAAVEKLRDGRCRYRRSGGVGVEVDQSGEHASPVQPTCNFLGRT